MEQNFCPNCGSQMQFSEAEICPKCGVRIKTPAIVSTSTNLKDPFLAAILSFLIPGLGQIYNGEVEKGIAYFLVAFVCAVLIFLLIGIILSPIWYIYQICEANTSAKRINQEMLSI